MRAHGDWCDSRVFPTACRDCGSAIFILICNCGSRVFFDSLGDPWPKHLCAQFLIRVHGFTLVQVDAMVRARAAQLSTDLPSIDHLFAQKLLAPTNAVAPIVKVEPAARRRVIGVVREKPLKLDPFKRLSVQPNSVAAQLLAKRLTGSVHQITIHVAPIGAKQLESFTFWVQGAHGIRDASPGALLAVDLDPVSIIGVTKFWLAVDLVCLDNSVSS